MYGQSHLVVLFVMSMMAVLVVLVILLVWAIKCLTTISDDTEGSRKNIFTIARQVGEGRRELGL